MNEEAVYAQDKLVRCIADGAPDNWIVGHFEIDPECENVLGSFLCDVRGYLVKVDAMGPKRISYDLFDAMRSLWNAMSREWNSMTVRIDNAGRYRFAFSPELVRLSDDGDIAYNPTTELVTNIISYYPNRSWDGP